VSRTTNDQNFHNMAFVKLKIINRIIIISLAL